MLKLKIPLHLYLVIPGGMALCGAMVGAWIGDWISGPRAAILVLATIVWFSKCAIEDLEEANDCTII